eukprot:scaffold49432_cov28-Prasinocladus_malaysianus.AAC.1
MHGMVHTRVQLCEIFDRIFIVVTSRWFTNRPRRRASGRTQTGARTDIDVLGESLAWSMSGLRTVQIMRRTYRDEHNNHCDSNNRPAASSHHNDISLFASTIVSRR